MRRTASVLLFVVMTVFFTFSSGTLLAQNIGSVEIKSAEVVRCGKLARDPQSTAENGYLQFASLPAGKSFLVLHLKLELTAGKDEDGDDYVQVEEESISLVNSAGEKFACTGTCTADGRYSMYAGGYSYYGKPKDQLYDFHPVFVIPAGAQALTLRMNKAEFKIETPQEVQETIKRSAVALFKVAKVAVVDQIETEEEYHYADDTKVDFKFGVESSVNKFLVVSLIIKPKTSNNESNNFYVSSSDFGVLYGAQVYVSPIGVIEEYNDEFSPGGSSYGSEPDAVGDYQAVEAKLVFPLPGRITRFKLQYLLEEVGGGAVSN